jgi:hypothetical protein
MSFMAKLRQALFFGQNDVGGPEREALRFSCSSKRCALDLGPGKAVACDGDGVPVFDRLRYRRQDGRVFLYAFDLLELNGRDMRREPLEVRKSALAGVLRRMKPWAGIQLNEHCDDLPADVVFPSRLQARLGGHREQAAWFALPVGSVARLAEDEKPERTRSEARGRRGLGPMTFLARHDAQTLFCRRRHQPRSPTPAKIRPGTPAPAMGPGTGVKKPRISPLGNSFVWMLR